MARRAGILVLATAALAAAATDPVAAILDQARGTPVEVFTDVAFRLIDAGKIAEKDRAALLDEVFLRAEEARQAMPVHPAAIPSPYATRADLHLDGLSIKCRVVQAMLQVDGKRSRLRFGEIARPQIPKPDCKESVLEDPTVYFDTLAAVATKAPFTAEEQKKQVPFWMMADAVRGIRTSIEIIAAARNFSQHVHSENEALAMSGAFAAALAIDDGDRNFSDAMRSSNLVDAVLIASDRFARLGAPPQPMQAALRGYLVRHLTASRCEDSPDAADPVSFFNTKLMGQTAVVPISADESKPAKREGKAEKTKTADLADFKEIARQINALFLKDPVAIDKPKGLTTDDFKDPDAAELENAVAKLQDWKGSAEQDAIEVFHRKVALYFNLLQWASPPRLRTTGNFRPAILSGLIATLEDTSILDASLSDWLSEVYKLLDRAKQFYADRRDGEQQTNVMVLTDIARAVSGSSLSALAVYGRLSAFLFPSPPWLAQDRLF